MPPLDFLQTVKFVNSSNADKERSQWETLNRLTEWGPEGFICIPVEFRHANEDKTPEIRVCDFKIFEIVFLTF